MKKLTLTVLAVVAVLAVLARKLPTSEPTVLTAQSTNSAVQFRSPIEHCYVINMANREDRWKQVQANFKNTLVEQRTRLQRWDATDGKQLTPEYIQTVTSRFCNYFCSNAMIGIWLSHYRLWKHIVDNNLNNVLVLEDDAKPIDDFDQKLHAYWAGTIPSDWDILFLGCFECEADANGRQSNINGNQHLFIPKSPAGMHGYMLTNEGARKLIQELKNVSYHIDIFLAKNVFNDPKKNIRMYAFKPYLIYQDIASESDNQANTHQLLTNLLQRFEFQSQWPSSSILNSQVMNIRVYDIPITWWSVTMFVIAFVVTLIPSETIRRRAFIGLTVYQAAELLLNKPNKTRTKAIFVEWLFIVLITVISNAYIRPRLFNASGYR